MKESFDKMEDLAAEIEYVMIKGVAPSTRECKKCNKGIANIQQNRCVTCGANEYLDDLSASGGECKKCPAGTYSPSNSYGLDSCLQKLPCTKEDMTYSFRSDDDSDCDHLLNTRVKQQTWKYPLTCDITKGEKLGEKEIVPCRGCTRGQHRDSKNACVWCSDGEYQDHDNHDGKGAKIKECAVCPAGHYAPRKLEYNFFESMPIEFFPSCSEANDLGKIKNCDLVHGWHVNLE